MFVFNKFDAETNAFLVRIKNIIVAHHKKLDEGRIDLFGTTKAQMTILLQAYLEAIENIKKGYFDQQVLLIACHRIMNTWWWRTTELHTEIENLVEDLKKGKIFSCTQFAAIFFARRIECNQEGLKKLQGEKTQIEKDTRHSREKIELLEQKIKLIEEEIRSLQLQKDVLTQTKSELEESTKNQNLIYTKQQEILKNEQEKTKKIAAINQSVASQLGNLDKVASRTSQEKKYYLANQSLKVIPPTELDKILLNPNTHQFFHQPVTDKKGDTYEKNDKAAQWDCVRNIVVESVTEGIVSARSNSMFMFNGSSQHEPNNNNVLLLPQHH